MLEAVSPPTTAIRFATSRHRMMLTEDAGDAELVLWDGREFGHW